MRKRFAINVACYLLAFIFIANSYIIICEKPIILTCVLPLFLFINALAGVFTGKCKGLRLKACYHGALVLTVFVISAFVSLIYHIIIAFIIIPNDYMTLVWSALFCIIAHVILFWNGIICVYLTSLQLGIKHRVIGAVCGMIPVLNLIALSFIIKITLKEVEFESEKQTLNAQRRALRLCATKYPILLVHGVFFRDNKYFNYWGRIPKELEINGAKIYYGNHQSAASIADSAVELKNRIAEILAESGAEKVNIIAHSKGGLDCRYAIGKLGIAPFVASLTTVNTPHRGCIFAEYLLDKIPNEIQMRVANTYNNALKKLGDKSPDFLAAVGDLTYSYCQQLDRELITPSGVLCQSIGSVIKKATNGKFPLNFSYHLVKYFDGENDGLVSTDSFEWGSSYKLLVPTGKRGISHGDVIDLNRENFDGFDVREFYVELVHDLKIKGL